MSALTLVCAAVVISVVVLAYAWLRQPPRDWAEEDYERSFEIVAMPMPAVVGPELGTFESCVDDSISAAHAEPNAIMVLDLDDILPVDDDEGEQELIASDPTKVIAAVSLRRLRRQAAQDTAEDYPVDAPTMAFDRLSMSAVEQSVPTAVHIPHELARVRRNSVVRTVA